MSSQTERLDLTQYDGGDSPKWIVDPNGKEASYNEDMAKIDAWALSIDPLTEHAISPIDVKVGGVSIGTRGNFAYANHSHSVLVGTTSTSVALNKPPSPGEMDSLARSDHTHNISTGTPSEILPGDTVYDGASQSLARADHGHSLPAFGTEKGTFCQGDDERVNKGKVAYDSLIPQIDVKKDYHNHDSIYSARGHLHSYAPAFIRTGDLDVDTLMPIQKSWVWFKNKNLGVRLLTNKYPSDWTLTPARSPETFTGATFNVGEYFQLSARARLQMPPDIGTNLPSYSIGIGIFTLSFADNGLPWLGNPIRLFTHAHVKPPSADQNISLAVSGIYQIDETMIEHFKYGCEIRMGLISTLNLSGSTKIQAIGSLNDSVSPFDGERYTGMSIIKYAPFRPASDNI